MRPLATALVRLFPSEFRGRYGADIEALVVAKIQDAWRSRGFLGALRTAAGQSLDVFAAARAERREQRSRASGARPTSSVAAPPPASGGGDGRISVLALECRRAIRALRLAPQFALVSIATLALGIGATTAIFSVVYGVLLAPLPYPDADELVAVWLRSSPMEAEQIRHTTSTYLTIRDGAETFADVGTFLSGESTITGEGTPERVAAMGVTDGALRALGATPHLGRLYTASDTAAGAPSTIILGYGFWQRRFGGDAGIVGNTIVMNGSTVDVIGVMQPGFRFLDRDPALYWPIRLDAAAMPTVLSFDYGVIGRLNPGVSPEEAAADVSRLLPASIERYAWVPEAQFEEWGLEGNVRPLKEMVVGDIGRLLWMVFGAVAIVFLVACANVANLYLVRAEGRRSEVAVRSALGASRGALARQFVIESLVVAVAGGVLGLAIAYAAVPLLLQLAPGGLPRVSGVGLETSTLLFCLAVSSVAGVGFGLVPLLRYGGSDLVSELKGGGRSAGESRRGNRLRTTLAVAEVALALVLLTGAGLMVRSFVALRGVEAGMATPEQVLTLRLSMTRGDFPQEEQVLAAYERILDGIAAIPGVSSVGGASGLAMEGRSQGNSFLADGSSAEPIRGAYKAVVGDYFDAAGIPLLAGRVISWEDVRNRRLVGVVNEVVATRFWGSPEAALGQRIRHSADDPWREIIGVVGSVRDWGLRSDPPPVAYWPVVVYDFLGFEAWLRRDVAFVIRAETGAESIVAQVREAIWDVDPALPIADLETLDQLVAADLAVPRFSLITLIIAAGVAVVLGTVGVYGVLSYAFAQRRREIGIRIAIGAAGRDVRALVFRQGLLVAGIGVAVGLTGAWVSARVLSTLVFDVDTHDPASFAIAALLTGSVALLATVFPALRAARTDPLEVLRR